MSENDAQRFNLVFAGQLVPGSDPARARRALADFFGLADPAAVEAFFSRRAVPLRRNLTREEAQRLYRLLRDQGLICEMPGAKAAPKSATIPRAADGKPRQRVRAGIRPSTVPTAQPAAPGTDHEADALPARARRPTAATGPEPAREAASAPEHRPAPARARASQAAPGPERPAARSRQRAAVPVAKTRRPADASQTPAGRLPDTAWPGAAVPKGPAPNLFALRPAVTRRADPALREQQQLRALVALIAACALIVVVLAASLRFPAAAVGVEPLGPLAAAARPGGELIMLQPQALLVHRRSGLAAARFDARTLGVGSFAPPLQITVDGSLLVGSRDDSGSYRLLRCDLALPSCETAGDDLALEGPPAVAESYLGDALFLLRDDGRLLRRDAAGVTTADNVLSTGASPRLAYHDGLLHAPAADSPLLGVFRPDRERFGAQIDALLLTPPAGENGSVRRIRDIAVAGDARWAILERDEGSALYRFDRQWGQPQRIAVTVGEDAYLVPWRDRILVADPDRGSAARVTADGRREAALTSELLEREGTEWRRIKDERDLLRRLGVILPLSLAALALLYALLQASAIRSLGTSVHGRTAILDPVPGGIHWLPAAPRRDSRARRLGLSLAVLALVPPVVLLSTGAWLTALCFLPLVAATLYARGAVARGLGGHLGFLGRVAVVIDHGGRYFYGPRELLRHGAGFVFAPGVALAVRPPALANISHYDRRAAATMPDLFACLGLLWQFRHPWLFAILAVAVGGLLSLVCVLLAA